MNEDMRSFESLSNTYRMFVGKPLVQRPFWKVMGLKDDIKMVWYVLWGWEVAETTRIMSTDGF
jgi:hypothetical protein